MGDAVEPFVLKIPQDQLDDLHMRLRLTRFPDVEIAPGWSQGAPLAQIATLRQYWLDHYDWRRCENLLNRIGQYRTQIDGCGIHFLHIRSPNKSARPLIMTHGWPGSVVEFLKVIGPLTEPERFGGTSEDAFHLVIPSLPGYGFSDHPTDQGWTVGRVSRAWAVLMERLGYDEYLAQGGDWGAGITSELAEHARGRLRAIHLNLCAAMPSAEDIPTLTTQEQAIFGAAQRHAEIGRGYSHIQGTRPQTLGYLLADSPIGQAAWIYEKYKEWSDCGDDPSSVFSMDEMLDNIMLYWLSNAGCSAGRMYWENRVRNPTVTVDVLVGISVFPKDIFRSTKRFAERLYPQLGYWNELDRGGHFAAFEVPDLFVAEVRSCFRQIG